MRKILIFALIIPLIIIIHNLSFAQLNTIKGTQLNDIKGIRLSNGTVFYGNVLKANTNFVWIETTDGITTLINLVFVETVIKKAEGEIKQPAKDALDERSKKLDEEKQKLASDPDVAAWMQKSWAMLEQKNWSETIRMSSVAISIDPLYSDAYAIRSWAYLEKGFRENALADAEKAVQLDPKNTSALNNRGLYYMRGGNSMKAKEDFKKACQGGLEIGCDNLKLIIDYCLKKAEEAFNRKDWDSVIRFTSEIAENEIALSVRCGAYANKGKCEAAITDCDAAIKMRPNLALAYNNKGYALELMGKKKEAALNYEFACNLNIPLGCSNLKRLHASE